MKIMIITHDKLFAKAFSAHLYKAEMDPRHSNNAYDGLMMDPEWEPDIILLDANVPGMNGLGALKWTQDDPRLQRIPIVLLTDRTIDPAILKECLMWGAHSSLCKDTRSVDEMTEHLLSVVKEVSNA